jgi:hypothetical protein
MLVLPWLSSYKSEHLQWLLLLIYVAYLTILRATDLYIIEWFEDSEQQNERDIEPSDRGPGRHFSWEDAENREKHQLGCSMCWSNLELSIW